VSALEKSGALTWNGKSRLRIEKKLIAGPVSIHLEQCSDVEIIDCDLAAIELSECQRVVVRNCRLHDTPRNGVSLYRSQEIWVEGCQIERVASGVYADQCQGVQVVGNSVRNVLGPYPRGQLAQFDNVTGKNNAICGNYGINESGRSHHEDEINLYMSQGEPASPLLVENNYLTGDSRQGSEGMSSTGSGIMLGDRGGAYIVCRHNVVISAGQVGIGIAGGRYIQVEDNWIYGEKSNVSNIGLYAWNQSGHPSDHITIAGNRVQWTEKSGVENSWWQSGGITDLVASENDFQDATLKASLPPPPERLPWHFPSPSGNLK